MKLLSVTSVFLLLFLSACLNDTGIPSGKEQLNNDIEVIDNYLANQNIVALKDVSGLRFTIESLGSGYPPRFDSKITFTYTGKLLDGTVFQSSTLTDASISGLITGLQIGLPLLPNGTKATFYIPSVYAYGSEIQNNIPANSNLIFQVFIKSIQVTQAEKTQLASDTIKIDNYLISQGIANVVRDSSGLRYVITEMGTGVKPSWLNKVKLAYTGYILTENSATMKFYTGSNEPNPNSDSRVANYIRGFQIGLQQMPKGSKAKFYVPSGMGFGTQQVVGGLTTVPANSNLMYEVELMDVLLP